MRGYTTCACGSQTWTAPPHLCSVCGRVFPPGILGRKAEDRTAPAVPEREGHEQ